MPATTIQVPAEHVAAIRRSLTGRREDPDRRDEIEDLLAQIASATSGEARPCELTAPRPVLWSAVYDALCATAERLADDCNEYWGGGVDPRAPRAAVADVGALLELLIGLGAPPGS
jgi:hypothetical protein